MSGGRLWRRIVVAWTVIVVIAGGLTLWLRDSTEPAGPAGWERSSPTPQLPEGWESMCPSPSVDPDGGRHIVACAFISG
ncbi:hypothetical protein ABZ896_09365 [Streptomyces sp. NPDC047072]|uniref:hypothetical protein n=1 Tax=Streptomyces sp. NPDC047072 TaxID=3154809 RepID=UPI0033E6AF10